jgi:aspartate aminotransferase
MPASPIRRLAPLAEAAKARGTRVLHLNIGQPDIETPPAMLDRLRMLDERVLEYSPSTGTPAFLNTVRHYYEKRLGQQLETGHILATTGGR